MKKIITLISLALILAVSASPSFSSDNKKHDYSGHFGDMDIDGDDNVNWEEFKKYFPHADKHVFEKADVNNDKLINHAEWHDFKEHNGYSKHHE